MMARYDGSVWERVLGMMSSDTNRTEQHLPLTCSQIINLFTVRSEHMSLELSQDA